MQLCGSFIRFIMRLCVLLLIFYYWYCCSCRTWSITLCFNVMAKTLNGGWLIQVCINVQHQHFINGKNKKKRKTINTFEAFVLKVRTFMRPGIFSTAHVQCLFRTFDTILRTLLTSCNSLEAFILKMSL